MKLDLAITTLAWTLLKRKDSLERCLDLEKITSDEYQLQDLRLNIEETREAIEQIKKAIEILENYKE